MTTQLINGDCFDVMKLLPDRCADLIVIDPPYEVSVSNNGGSINNIKGFNKSTIQVADKNLDEGYDFATFSRLIERLQEKTNIYIWTSKKQIPMYFEYFVGQKKCLFDILFWHKQNAIPSYSNKYLTDTEYCLYFKQGGAYNKPQSYADAKTLYLDYINHSDKKKYNHPTIKPLPFLEKMVRNSCPLGGTVLDPFMGSGTTGVACRLNGRNFIGIEIDEEYYETAKLRIDSVI